MKVSKIRGKNCRRAAPVLFGLVLSHIAAFPALADSYSFTDDSSTTLTYAPTIVGGVNTNFTSYNSSFSWIYTLNTFTVDTTGLYSVSATTSHVVNTTFVLNGTYLPTSTFPPQTPISQFIASSFSGGNTATIPNLELVQGQTYSVLVAYNQTTAGSYPYTVLLTFTGVGCVSIYLNSCSSMTEELKLQAAQQGVMLNDMQSRAVVGQLRQRMQTGGMDRTPTGSLVHAYASEAKNDYNDVFGFATAGNDTSGRWTAWADTGADGLRGNWNPDVRGYQASQQFGLDYRFANGWVAGAAVGASIFGSDFDNGGETSGNAYWISPYLGMQFDDWMVTLQTTYSYVDYNTFTIGTGINGDTHGQRFSGSVSVARQFDLGNAFYMIPEVTLSVGRERISDISALTSGNVNDPRFFSSKIGGELGYNLSNDSRVYGLAFAEYINTNADTATASLSTGYKAKDWSATLGGAVDVKLADRTSLSLEGRVRGLGSDTLIYGGNARLNINF